MTPARDVQVDLDIIKKGALKRKLNDIEQEGKGPKLCICEKRSSLN
jgi:hypothetical protein